MGNENKTEMTPGRAAEVLRMAATWNGCGRASSAELDEARELAIKALEKMDEENEQTRRGKHGK